MDYRSMVIALAVLLVGFGVGYLARPAQVYKEVHHIPTTVTHIATLTVRHTATQTVTTVLVSEPEIYIYQPPEGLRVKVVPEGVWGIVRLRIYITNTGNTTVRNIYILALGYSYAFGASLETEYVDMIEPNITRLAVIGFDIICSKYYVMVVVVD